MRPEMWPARSASRTGAIGQQPATEPLRRQPAEGRPRPMAAVEPDVFIMDEPTRGIDVGRQVRHLHDHRPAGGERRRRPVHLVRAGGADRHVRPDPGHEPGRDRGRVRSTGTSTPSRSSGPRSGRRRRMTRATAARRPAGLPAATRHGASSSSSSSCSSGSRRRASSSPRAWPTSSSRRRSSACHRRGHDVRAADRRHRPLGRVEHVPVGDGGRLPAPGPGAPERVRASSLAIGAAIARGRPVRRWSTRSAS